MTITPALLDEIEETLEFCAERAAFSHVHAKLARDILKTARKRDDVKVARDDHAPGLSSLVIGEPVEKVGGKYGGPGKLVARWTDEHGDEMNVVAHRIEGGCGMFKHVYPAKMVVPQAPRQPEPAPIMPAASLSDDIFTPEFFDDESVRGLWKQNDNLCDLFNRLIEVLGEPTDDITPDTVNDWIVGQVRGLKDATPAMSAETMREAAAMLADKCAEQNKAAAIKLRKRQHSETDTWNSNELDDTAAEAKAIAVMIRALPLTAPKEG